MVAAEWAEVVHCGRSAVGVTHGVIEIAAAGWHPAPGRAAGVVAGPDESGLRLCGHTAVVDEGAAVVVDGEPPGVVVSFGDGPRGVGEDRSEAGQLAGLVG